MALANLFTRKYAKILLILMIVLVCSQYLFNVLIASKMPLSLIGFMNKNSSVLFFQRSVTGNYSGERVTTARPKLDLCPIIPSTLKGPVTVNTQIPSWAYLEADNQILEPGGRYKPSGCKARHRVAVIIPFRDRDIHLKIFLQNIHPFLQRQQIEYGIFVIELVQEVKFNRALLMNIGFVEALKSADYQCFIFHDVDLIPEDDRNLYICPQSPRHMSVAIDRLGYRLPYAQLFGGVSAITKEHFKKINGFSNLYFGWGGEDDDIYRRILYSNLTVSRYSPKVARYKMLIHKKANGNPQRFNLLREMRRRYLKDGLSSLNYTIVKAERKLLYTWVLIRVDQKEMLRPFTIRVVPKRPIPPPIIHKTQNVKQNKPGAPKKIQENKTTKQQLQPQQQSQRVKPKSVQATKVIQQKPKPPVKKRQNLPNTIDWVPTEFKGKIPDYLTNYDHLKKPVTKAIAATKTSKRVTKTLNQSVKSAIEVVKTNTSIKRTASTVNTSNNGVIKGLAQKSNGGQNNGDIPPTSIKHVRTKVEAAYSLLPKEARNLTPDNVKTGNTHVPKSSITDSPEHYQDSTRDLSSTSVLPSKQPKLHTTEEKRNNVIMERDVQRQNDESSLT